MADYSTDSNAMNAMFHYDDNDSDDDKDNENANMYIGDRDYGDDPSDDSKAEEDDDEVPNLVNDDVDQDEEGNDLPNLMDHVQVSHKLDSFSPERHDTWTFNLIIRSQNSQQRGDNMPSYTILSVCDLFPSDDKDSVSNFANDVQNTYINRYNSGLVVADDVNFLLDLDRGFSDSDSSTHDSLPELIEWP